MRTMPPARLDELARVVAVRAADDDDDIALPGEVGRCDLPILRRPADRVDESDQRVRKLALDEINDMPHFCNRLRRLRGNADPRMRLEREYIVVFKKIGRAHV